MYQVARVALAAAGLFLAVQTAPAQQGAPDLTGLWAGKVRFGPDIRGPLLLIRQGSTWRADIAGFSEPVRRSAGELSFELPDRRGSFRGRLNGAEIAGQWIGPVNQGSGMRATPVVLRPAGPGRWRGMVTPLDDASTFYLPLTRVAGGGYATYLRNPERNQGRFIRATRLEVKDDVVTLRGVEPAGPPLAEGRYEDGIIRLPLNGTSFDFTRADSETWSPFYPRGKAPQRYHYAPPLRLDDGWPVATLDDVGISRAGIEAFVQRLIDMPMDSLSSPQIHSLLIARHGKLVVEEYFHGYHRDQPHDLRSASKSWVAVLLGAAMQAGVPIRLNTPVYQTMLEAHQEVGPIDPRKRAMTLEHLISMTAGYDCASDSAPGNEDVMQSQTAEPDWYRYTLDVPMLTAPGDTIVYCSIEPNLAGGMLRKIAGEPLPEMFYRLVARPLQMHNYHLFLSPTGEAYGGGGHQFVPRDFLKLAQLMVNQGRWNGRQIMSRDWALKSGSALRNLSKIQQYGWLWNSVEYPYKGRTVRAFFAGGNGGQIFMGIPALDLVIGFTGGNYNDPSLFIPQRRFVPDFILPAVR